MALLHFFHANAAQYNITLSALNCDHGMRKETSARDSAFVKQYCEKEGIPLTCYVANRPFRDENEARGWRVFTCYAAEAEKCDCIATAHHMRDNAETVLFNLARGTALTGMRGITDAAVMAGGRPLNLIRPLIDCTREEIENYVAFNNVPYVDDETNFTDDYTRNKIRHNVLPALEDAVPGALRAIYRFSRIAAEYDDYFAAKAAEITGSLPAGGAYIEDCAEKVIFRRAAHTVVAGMFGKKDYTAEHFEKMYELQSAENGKKFEFLGLTAYREDGRICVVQTERKAEGELPYAELVRLGVTAFGGEWIRLTDDRREVADSVRVPLKKALRFDADKIPAGAVIRFMKQGDRIAKFGGGTKNLGDYFTDKKIPLRLRRRIPLLCTGSDVLIIFGVEISATVKTDELTKNVLYAIALAYANM